MNNSSLSTVRVAQSTPRAFGTGIGLNARRLSSSRLARQHLHLAATDCPVPADAVPPSSVAAIVGSGKPQWPHLRLMRAVLDDAVSIVVFGGVRASAVLRSETVNWFLAEDDGWAFSFRNVCDALDLDVDRLRARMAPWLTLRSTRR
jgi:hypothetical protein